MSYLGRGFENVAGRPFGWAWHRERQEIRDHLTRRGWKPPEIEFRVTRIQERLHRYRPTFRQRQEAARARGEAWVPRDPEPRPPEFSREELERLVELFAGGNDPVTQSIAAKAAARLSS